MARFILVHTLPTGATQEGLIDCATQVRASLPPGVEWLNSWWITGEWQRLFCEWEAPDADAVRAALEPVLDTLPIESLYEAEWINPDWYKE